ncbi:DegT/DnrJ/EryC1/StrS family aminotransferase [Candidatus Daviesbacteria bacterium]|nr:DegT/DnrJ/EryC1/StrS family aminotransferase [Candidatus Daviesbacteria bacterium]
MHSRKLIPIAKPIIDQKEIDEVVSVLKSGELSSGKWVEKFEDEFAKFIKVKYAVAVSSGTTALYLALLALGIEKGDEVITTPFTFIASSNAILYTGAKPVFVDIDPKTFNIDPDKIEQNLTFRTKAILPVHLYGLPADMKKILQIAKKHHLFVLEDAAQAHGAKIDNRLVGSFGDLAAFSFYPTKNMTTGEGGMITTNDEILAKKLKMLRNHGMEKRYYHDSLGFNFRMTNMAAAIGIHQLKKLNKFNKNRAENAQFLTEHLSTVDGIQTPFIPPGFTHVFHQYTVLIKKDNRNKLAEYLNKNGVSTSIYYPIPVHKQKFMLPMYPNLHLKNAETVASEVLSLPVHPAVKKGDLARIANLIRKYFS